MRIHSLLSGLAVLLVATSGHGASSRSQPSFDQRVAAQSAIEQVYWSHRIWPAANRVPKPPVSHALSDAEIRAKVTDGLAKSRALRTYWSRPLTAVQLQAELDRMAAQSRAPEVLKEIFAALGEDPAMIVETLVRPSLAERAIRSAYAYDERFHGETARRAREAAATIASPRDMKTARGDYREVRRPRGELERLDRELPLGRVSGVVESEDGFHMSAVLEADDDEVTVATLTWPKEPFDAWWTRARGSIPIELEAVEGTFRLPAVVGVGGCAEDAWTTGSPSSSLPDRRTHQAAVWTGSELIVWGGLTYANVGFETCYLDSGSRFDPVTNVWTAMAKPDGILAHRADHTAVWTGTEMIVWGGAVSTHAFADGARYDPGSNTWQAIATADSPSARAQHSAVWTGTEMVVWGGQGGGYLGTGARYDPAADTWSPTPAGAGVPEPRALHTAVWTGSRMIVWGGQTAGSQALDSGAAYDPGSDSWSPTPAGGPSARFGHSAVWTGSEMIVWGGQGPGYLGTGARYDPLANAWSPTSMVAAPGARAWHVAVWTGAHMIVWGGQVSSGPMNTGGRYSPATDSWLATSVGAQLPSARSGAAAVWTGTRMIVWGGQSGPTTFDTGGSYDPAADAWVATPGGSGLQGRRRHSAVWTGAEMIVWGGSAENLVYFASGGRYDPATDTWLATAAPPASLVARDGHTAVWTGTEMIVWGGYNGSALTSGGRYSPATNAWAPTSSSGLPGRRGHTAVWTGTRMIVWGGSSGLATKTGSRYDPVADTWSPTSEPPTLAARSGHVAVWTGSRMLVWGGFQGPAEGSSYDPVANAWGTITATGAPQFRSGATAVWTGTEMIVWGGINGSPQFPVNTGGRYDPATGLWSLTSTGAGVPSAREGHTGIWTGTEMIVWGGDHGGSATGGRYDPSSNTWSATATEGSATGSTEHTAVWTGSRMVVWSGSFGFSSVPGLYCASCFDLDADDVCNAADNCPGAFNPGQENGDGDAFGNACDCAPSDPTNPEPGPVSGLAFTSDPEGATIEWLPAAQAVTYDVVRGDLASLPVGPGSGDEACFPDLSSPTLVDASVPAGGYFYVVRGRNACGAGPYGVGSGAPRITDTCP